MAGRGVVRGRPPPDQITPSHAGADPLPGQILPPPVAATEWSLERTSSALRALDDPHRAYATVHVGGTNGKGSVSAMVASVLQAAGHRVGLYTSPHLCSFAERFRIDGEPVSVDRLRAAAAEAYEPIRAAGLTFFEAATVLGFELFDRARVDVAVVEVGLGGRLDATNVVIPAVTAITNVALDHTEYLGTSLESIAREKAGIVKPGVPLVTGAAEPEVLAVLRDTAAERGAPLTVVAADSVADLESVPGGSRFHLAAGAWSGETLHLPLAGAHQAHNAAVALHALEVLPEAIRPSAAAVRAGLAAVRWPGRMQVERIDDATWIFDVAHNEAGARALASALGAVPLPRPRIGLVALQADKDAHAHGRWLMPHLDRAVLTAPPSVQPERRWDLVRATAQWAPLGPVQAVPDFDLALRTAADAARGGSVLVTGSHHTVGDALRRLDIAPCRGTTRASA